jgi:hypothetical protein
VEEEQRIQWWQKAVAAGPSIRRRRPGAPELSDLEETEFNYSSGPCVRMTGMKKKSVFESQEVEERV